MVTPLNVLIIEDLERDCLLILNELQQGGYETIHQQVHTLEELEDSLTHPWDLIICDYALAEFDLIDALRLLREKNLDLPFLIVAETISNEMAIAAIKEGAHDYLIKDNLYRLVTVVERELRDAMMRRERRKSESQLHEQAALLDVAQDAILVLDFDDQICYWNKSAERLYGWTLTEALHQKAIELLFADTVSLYTEVKNIVKEQGEWQGEWNQRTKDQDSVMIESRWKLLCDSEDQPKSILVVNTDITAKKQLEAQFLRSQRLESIGTLAGGIAHDLNNVLAPILMSVEILKMKLTDSSSLQLLNSLESSAKRGAEIIKQVLTFARGSEGEKGDLQLKHIIREMVQIARETFPKSIEIFTDIPKDLWLISGDPTQLQQVLLNLSLNARDAMPNGGQLTIKAKNIWLDQTHLFLNLEAKPGAYVLLSVLDTGEGIPSHLKEKIFEPFFTTKPIGKGTGLGLSTLMGIVKSHRGFIEIDSVHGKGSCFKIYFPAQNSTNKILEVPLEEKIIPGNGEGILLIDDERAIRDITKKTLLSHSYHVFTAEDGAEGIAVYVSHKDRIDGIIVDMKMPIMDGPSTIRALRKLNPYVKIIISSGVAFDEQQADLSMLRVNGILQKPYTSYTLLKLLSEVLH